jgi:hypothetical protein
MSAVLMRECDGMEEELDRLDNFLIPVIILESDDRLMIEAMLALAHRARSSTTRYPNFLHATRLFWVFVRQQRRIRWSAAEVTFLLAVPPGVSSPESPSLRCSLNRGGSC